MCYFTGSVQHLFINPVHLLFNNVFDYITHPHHVMNNCYWNQWKAYINNLFQINYRETALNIDTICSRPHLHRKKAYLHRT